MSTRYVLPSRSASSGIALRGRRAGFTLLELLIASALSATLLLALWTMFSLYVDLFQTGSARTELAQVARAVVQQLSDDLHHAIQDPLPGQPRQRSGQTAVRRFGLLGTATGLRIDVLQPTPELPNFQPVSDSEGIFGETAAPRVPELRTIYYEFHDPAADLADQSTVESYAAGSNEETEQQLQPPGLVRRELDFEAPVSSADTAEGGLLATADPALNSDPFNEQQPADWFDWVERFAEGTDIWVPEVVGLSFRYFDGQSWSSSWNSLQRRALPVAIEVTLQMVARDELDQWLSARQEALQTPGGPDELGATAEPVGPSNLPEETASVTTGPQVRVFRCVIDVPGSPIHPAPRSGSRIAVQRTERRAVQRVLSRRSLLPPVRRQSPAPLPDQWIRTNP